ncbi:MAG: adenylate/guanylate cyclase domain-containing protein [Acidimicrobiia bacterium]|nr:hypothetical protein [Acidimicrobiia bacterium]MCL4292178.1 adenylate/guanylate cyclase domain-containing protein [Acidimicrobiia bacterium]
MNGHPDDSSGAAVGAEAGDVTRREPTVGGAPVPLAPSVVVRGDDAGGHDVAVDRKLRSFLRRRGARSDEIDRAAREGWLSLLTVDRMLMPGKPRYTLAEMSRRAGADEDFSRRLWRALGFPDLPADAKAFTDSDAETLETLIDSGNSPLLVGDDEAAHLLVQQVRVASSLFARYAEMLSDQIFEALRRARELGVSDVDAARLIVENLDWRNLSRLNDYALRIQTRAAMWRKLGAEDPEVPVSGPCTVGFVDLVGYTALSQQLDADDLAGLVSRFEELAYDTVAEHGGRVVKMIGDEVMFVADDPLDAVEVALHLATRSDGDDLLPTARAALAYGPLLAREGDYYGPVVNLASRSVGVARPGTVIASAELRNAVGDDADLVWSRLWPRRIRSIGWVELWAVRRPEPEAG